MRLGNHVAAIQVGQFDTLNESNCPTKRVKLPYQRVRLTPRVFNESLTEFYLTVLREL